MRRCWARASLCCPLSPNPAWKPTGGEDPTLRILGLLAATIGLPYFLLSTTGPLVQAWFVREQSKPGFTPYRLYALSNLGSMLALLSYPVLVEPYFVTRWQGYGWSAGYVAFVVFCGFTAWRAFKIVAQADRRSTDRAADHAARFELIESELIGYERGAFTGASKDRPGKSEVAPVAQPLHTPQESIPHQESIPDRESSPQIELGRSLPSTGQAISLPHPDPTLMVTWVLLAACASTLLLAITNHLSQNVAAIPFLWVLPLALYLLSFILCFDGDGWYRRHLFLGLFAVSIGSMVYALFADSENMPLKVALPLFATGMFACCMVCHGELARLKPDPRHLTLFYLMVSIGGAVGGIFVGLIAPRVFSGYYELPLGLVATAALIVSVLRRDLLAGGAWAPAWLASVIVVLGLAGYVGYSMKLARGEYRVAVRNFYGGLKVDDTGTGKSAVRRLTHGTIDHGEEYLDPDRRHMPTTYYGPHSGVALAIKNIGDGPRHIGVIGLGTGTIAAHGRPGDSILYYEINPLVIGIARTEFFYLRDCEAKLDIVLGDARLSLEREPDQEFDVLAVDAFRATPFPSIC